MTDDDRQLFLDFVREPARANLDMPGEPRMNCLEGTRATAHKMR